MGYYEKCFLTYEEAMQAQKITGGVITSFLTLGENENIITVYCLKYKQLF